MNKPQPAYTPGYIKDERGVCMECDHHKVPANREGYQDWVRGTCSLMGYSTIPPMWTCKAWAPKRRRYEA